MPAITVGCGSFFCKAELISPLSCEFSFYARSRCIVLRVASLIWLRHCCKSYLKLSSHLLYILHNNLCRIPDLILHVTFLLAQPGTWLRNFTSTFMSTCPILSSSDLYSNIAYPLS